MSCSEDRYWSCSVHHSRKKMYGLYTLTFWWAKVQKSVILDLFLKVPSNATHIVTILLLRVISVLFILNFSETLESKTYWMRMVITSKQRMMWRSVFLVCSNLTRKSITSLSWLITTTVIQAKTIIIFAQCNKGITIVKFEENYIINLLKNCSQTHDRYYNFK